MTTRDPILVIGAGPAGLAAATALQAHGLPFEIVEAGPSIGGIWDVSRDDTPMYETAHFISSKSLSGFRDLPMPVDYPDYPRHDLVLRYIRDYADHHGLTARVRLGTRVTHAEPVPSGGWRVEFEGAPPAKHSALVVATGMAWHPFLPEFEGEFEGEVIHSSAYRGPAQLTGRRVLVVGAGNSGVDIASDAARSASAAFLSVRRGYRFVPKYIFGKPADVFAKSGPSLPLWIEKRIFALLLDRLLVGDLTRFGLPRPDHDVLASHPIMNTQVLHHLGHGDLAARPDIARFEGRRVHFVDGRSDEVDLVILATGYRRLFPFLPEAVGTGTDRPLDLYLNVFHRSQPGLAFVGLFETDGAAYGLMGLQAELVARVFDQEPPDFTERRRSARPNVRGAHRYLDSQRHDYYVNSRAYTRLLETEAANLGA